MNPAIKGRGRLRLGVVRLPAQAKLHSTKTAFIWMSATAAIAPFTAACRLWYGLLLVFRVGGFSDWQASSVGVGNGAASCCISDCSQHHSCMLTAFISLPTYGHMNVCPATASAPRPSARCDELLFMTTHSFERIHLWLPVLAMPRRPTYSSIRGPGHIDRHTRGMITV